MQRDMVENVPHVQGNSEEPSDELMEGIGEDGDRGNEKSCMRRNLSGLFAFGIKDMGEVWKWPMAASSCALVYGPSWRRVEYSCCKIEWKCVE